MVRIGSRTLSAEELGARGATSRAERRRIVEQAVARVVASREAEHRGLAEAPATRQQLDALRREAQAREEALLRDALFESARDALKPTEADLRVHYEGTKLRYAERQVKLRWWTFASSDAARAVLDAKSAAAALTPEKAEILGPLPLSSLPAKVVPEIFHLAKPGDRIAAGSEPEGFGVVELVEVLPAAPLPFEAVRDRAEASWRTLEGQKAFAKLMADLRAKADVEIDEAVLANDALWEPAQVGAHQPQ